jgi:hypothetical protein
MNYNDTHLYYRSDPNSTVDVVIVLGADWAAKNTLPDDE